MTKKSAGRQERDRQEQEHADILKTNRLWDDLKEKRIEILTQFSNLRVIAEIGRDPELIKFVENIDQLNEDIQLLTSDLIQIFKDIEEIYNYHKDKTGNAATDQDYAMAVETYQNYAMLLQRVEGTLIPTGTRITGTFIKAEEKMLLAKRTPPRGMGSPVYQIDEMAFKVEEPLTPLEAHQILQSTGDLIDRPMVDVQDLEVK